MCCTILNQHHIAHWQVHSEWTVGLGTPQFTKYKDLFTASLQLKALVAWPISAQNRFNTVLFLRLWYCSSKSCWLFWPWSSTSRYMLKVLTKNFCFFIWIGCPMLNFKQVAHILLQRENWSSILKLLADQVTRTVPLRSFLSVGVSEPPTWHHPGILPRSLISGMHCPQCSNHHTCVCHYARIGATRCQP